MSAGRLGSLGGIISNKDVQVSGSQSAAEAAFLAELASQAANGQTDTANYWHKLLAANTGNKLYPKT